MKSTLKAFGATLDQICTAASAQFGERGVADDAKNLPSVLALTAASERAHEGLPGAVGKWLFASAFAASAALAHNPVSAQPMAAQPVVAAQTVGVSVPGTGPAQILGGNQGQGNDGRKEGNTKARIIGGGAGAALGAILTQGAGGLATTAAMAGLGYLGQAAGDIATRNVTDQNGNLAMQSGVDSRGRPIYSSVSIASPKPGTTKYPQLITAEVYENAVARAASTEPGPVSQSTDGLQYRSLDANTHKGLYALMVETLATRAVAKLARQELDSANLARTVTPNDPKIVTEFFAANRTYEQSFKAYAQAYQQTTNIINLAQRTQFDVSSQALLMNLVPGDVRGQPGVDIHWPGVDDRIRVLGAKMNEDHSSTYNQITALVEKNAIYERQRQ